MSVDFINFLEEIIKEKEELDKDELLLEQKKYLKDLRELFYEDFPELLDSKWKLDADEVSKDEFEFYIGGQKFYVKRSQIGHRYLLTYKLQTFCHGCSRELKSERPTFYNITSLKKELDNNILCPKCKKSLIYK